MPSDMFPVYRASETDIMMLLKNFNSAATVADNMTKLANRYHELYTACHVRISNYRNTAIETQLMGGLGNAAKAAGQKLASVPILSKGTVDEALIHAGEALDKHSNVILEKGMKQFESLTDTGMLPFIENIQKVDMIYNRSDALLIDGESLYIIDAV